MASVKITIVKCLDQNEIHSGADLGCSFDGPPVCGIFKEGQEIIVEEEKYPDGFCVAAYNAIYPYVSTLQRGGNFRWMNEKGTILGCCPDGFRPVVFRIERIEE
jgi:uncharacterized repeat protein (TIGR04076 family)